MRHRVQPLEVAGGTGDNIHSTRPNPEVVTSAKYLVVDIFDGLSWNPHIAQMNKNATRTLTFVQRNIKTKIERYKRLSITHWYVAPVWDPHTKEKVLQLEKYNVGTARWTKSNKVLLPL